MGQITDTSLEDGLTVPGHPMEDTIQEQGISRKDRISHANL